MDYVLTNFWRVLILIIISYLLYIINKSSINNTYHFIKRYLFSLILAITCSTIILIGIIFNHFISHVLNDSLNAGLNCLINNTFKNTYYVIISDIILIILIPSTLIMVYSFYANNFRQSYIRSLSSSIIIFLMADLIINILGGESPSAINRMLLGLFHDIIGGIIFGFIISITLLYYKRLFIDSAFDKKIKLVKYYKLLFTIVLNVIFIYFIFLL
jgi:hypothetical protein